jgi:RsiW-degrading membrane proteinase PrsW (M82 family)
MKLLLTVQSGSLAGRTYELTNGSLTIGRGENCRVRFDPLTERLASKQHAYIEAKLDGFYLIDNQSSNGTLLNNQKIQSVKLKSGDRIQFGKNGVEAIINLQAEEFGSERTQFKPNFQPVPNLQVQLANQSPQSAPVNWKNSLSGIGVSRVQEPVQPSQTGKYIGVAAAIFSVVFLSLIVMLLMFASVGIGAAIGASVIAFLPAMFYLLPLIWLDRYDPEPLWLLAVAFAWGALVAVIVSFIVNTLIGAVVGASVSPEAGEFVGGVISAPVFEEGSKGLGLLVLLIFFRKYFDDILDGIIFAGVIALGFATVENVLYYGRGINEGKDALVALLILRGIMSPFAHVSFTAMTGIGCGIARESHNTFVRILLPILGYGAAVALHAIWNGMATIGGLGGFFIGYIILEVPFFLIFVGFAFYTMHRQNKILKEMLAIDVARGMIPQEHLNITSSAFRSSFWILGGLFNGRFKARNNYLRAVGKLGLSYWHIQRATAAQGHTGSFQQNPILRDEVLRWRDKV